MALLLYPAVNVLRTDEILDTRRYRPRKIVLHHALYFSGDGGSLKEDELPEDTKKKSQ